MREIIHDSRRYVPFIPSLVVVMYYLAFNFTPLGRTSKRRHMCVSTPMGTVEFETH